MHTVLVLLLYIEPNVVFNFFLQLYCYIVMKIISRTDRALNLKLYEIVSLYYILL